jgi:Protein of unknown function (DUF3667)
MNDFVESIGTAATGGLLARVLEPESGARLPHPHQPETCLNCATPLVGAFCHACGQGGHIHRSLSAIGHDLLHGVFHFEGKLWRTLPMLALRPGALTRRYIAGERARFVSPMALFLFGVFAMFAVFQMVGMSAPTDVNTNNVTLTLEQARAKAIADRDEAAKRLAAIVPGDPRRERAEERLQDRNEEVSELANLDPQSWDAYAESKAEERLAAAGWLMGTIAGKWRDNPGLMLYKLQSNSYKFSWLLIPLSVPFVWLLFAWRRRFKAYDHAIFVTYSLSFMTFLFITLSALGVAGVGSELLMLTGVIVVPLHIYKHLRGAYELSRSTALWRLVVLSAFIAIILTLFLQAMVLLGGM